MRCLIERGNDANAEAFRRDTRSDNQSGVGEILDVRLVGKSIRIRNAKHVHFVQSFISGGKERLYDVDVVTEDFLPGLISLIEEEARKIALLLKRNNTTLRKSIKRMAAMASSIDPSELREILLPQRLAQLGHRCRAD